MSARQPVRSAARSDSTWPSLIELLPHQATSVLAATFATRIVHQDPPHRFSGHRKEVAARIPMLDFVDIHESDVCRATIVAVNETTGRQISIRSAQRLRPLPTVVRIGDLQKVHDLQPGHRAVPETHVQYDVRPVDGTPLGLTVDDVARAGDALVAHASDGAEYRSLAKGRMSSLPDAR